MPIFRSTKVEVPVSAGYVTGNCGKQESNKARLQGKVSATAVVGILAANGHRELLCCPAAVFLVGGLQKWQTSLFRHRASCKRCREGSPLVGEGPDQQGVSLRVPLPEWAAWPPAASGVSGVKL